MSSPTSDMTDPARTMAHQSSMFAADLARDERGTKIEVSRPHPPQEVLDQMLQADAIGQLMRERGQALSFTFSAENRLMSIELCDSHGELLRTVSTSEAMEIAAGKPGH